MTKSPGRDLRAVAPFTKVRNRVVALGIAMMMATTGMLTLGTGTARADVKGWTTVAWIQNPYAVTLICKQYTSGGYGPVWRIKTAALASPGSFADIRVQVIRYNYVVNRSTAQTNWNGQWVSKETYASIYYNDRLRVYFNVSNGHQGEGGGWISMPISNIRYCGG